jgi:hypothetical protein
MAYLYLNDGGPDANEYTSNYLLFDETNQEALADIQNVLQNNDANDLVIQARLRNICKSSLQQRTGRSLILNMDLVNSVSKAIRTLIF